MFVINCDITNYKRVGTLFAIHLDLNPVTFPADHNAGSSAPRFSNSGAV